MKNNSKNANSRENLQQLPSRWNQEYGGRKLQLHSMWTKAVTKNAQTHGGSSLEPFLSYVWAVFLQKKQIVVAKNIYIYNVYIIYIYVYNTYI